MDSYLLIGWLGAAAVLGLLASTIWRRKGGSPTVGFAIGFIFGIFGLFFVALISPRSRGHESSDKICPQCTQTIGSEGGVCPFCGYALSP